MSYYSRVLPVDLALLRRAAWQPTVPKQRRQTSAPSEDELRAHRRKRRRIIARRRKAAFRERWLP